MVTAEKFHALVEGVRRCRLLWTVAALLLGLANAYAQTHRPPISEIRIVGNQRVEHDAIALNVSSRVGQPLEDAVVDQDVKAIYRMGFFEHVGAEIEHPGGQTVLVFRVTERPLVSDVRLEGMKKVKPTDDKVINAVKLHSGAILDGNRVEATIKALKAIYDDVGYLDAQITFSSTPRSHNTAAEAFPLTAGPGIQ